MGPCSEFPQLSAERRGLIRVHLGLILPPRNCRGSLLVRAVYRTIHFGRLLLSRFSTFAPVATLKNEGGAGKFDKIPNSSLLFSAWSISRLFDEKAREKHAFGRSVA